MNQKRNKIISAILMACSLISLFPGNTAADNTIMPIGIASLAEGELGGGNLQEDAVTPPLSSAVFIANLALELSGEEPTETVKTISAAEKEDPPVIKAMVNRMKARANSVYNTLAISQVESFVNIRLQANSESEVVGKIYNNAAATILERVEMPDGLWYKIHSGTVEGFIKAQYFATGDEAAELAAKIGMVFAKIKTESLRLREKPDIGSKTVSVISGDNEYLVVSQGDEFSKLSIDQNTEGYAQNDYLEIIVRYEEAISIAEEKAKLEEAARLKKAAQEAAEKLRKEKEEKAKKTSTTAKTTKKTTEPTTAKKTTEPTTTKKTTSSGPTKEWRDNGSSALRDAIVAEAVQYVGVLKYVLGGNSLETGTDCSGFVQIIYRKFGIKLPRVSDEQGFCGEAVKSEDMRPGDLIYYKGHIGIYIGNGEVCHCSTSKSWPNTKISTWNYRQVYGIRNVIGD